MEKEIPQNIRAAASELARMGRPKIKGTPAARARAAKAGRLRWAKKLKAVFEAGFDMGQSGTVSRAIAWEVFCIGQNKVKHQVPP